MTIPATDLCVQLHERFLEIQHAPTVDFHHPNGHVDHLTPNREAGAHFQGALQGLTHLADVMERDSRAVTLARKDAHA